MTTRGANGFRSGGTRGGAAEFKWDDVKSDKYRECYLGHSVKANTGRWQKNKDVLWYTKQAGGGGDGTRGACTTAEERKAAVLAQAALERAELRRRDEDQLNQKLVLVPLSGMVPYLCLVT